VNKLSAFVIFVLFTIINTQPAVAEKMNLHHVVIVWLQEDVDDNTRAQLIEESKKLAEIKQVRQLHIGAAITSDRDIVDDSFDFAMTMTFDSTEDMGQYITHPQHREFVEDRLKPYIKKVVVYDY